MTPLRRLAVTSYRQARRVVILVIGSTLLLCGLVMLVVPGPGLVAIAAALAVLGIEFAWARRWLRELKQRGRRVTVLVFRGSRSARGGSDAPPARDAEPGSGDEPGSDDEARERRRGPVARAGAADGVRSRAAAATVTRPEAPRSSR